jgi:predicted nucleic acid-binding protein
MKTVVVDANKILSALIATQGRSAEVLLQPNPRFRLISCHFIYIELFKHKEKIQRLSGLDEAALLDLLYAVFSQLELVNEAYIPFACWQEANRLTADLDPKDIPYVALTIHLDGWLWTGDKRLMDGLRGKGFDRFVSTDDLLLLE